MAVPTLTWRPSAVYVVPSTNVAGALSSLKDAVDAEVTANPTTAVWEVADWNSGNGTLVLRRRASAGGGSRRIMFFGGVLPSTAATGGANAAATTLYAGVAPTAGVDAPQQAYSVGVPFTTGAWIPSGFVAGTFTAVERVQYWECTDGVAVVWRRFSTSSSGNVIVAAAGGLATDSTDSTVIDIAFASFNVLSTTPLAVVAGSGQLVPGGSNPSASNARCHILFPGDTAATLAFRIHGMGSGDASRLRDGQQVFFLPMFLGRVAFEQLGGKLRQLAFGPAGTCGQTLSTASGIIAYGISDRLDTNADALWLTNFKV